ncbi:AAA family ATPase [Vibrio owensii]|uniref:AAA family ATPase n=1 Tax=Vibrio owensii TaxID=696485 RepID=UPI002F42A013
MKVLKLSFEQSKPKLIIDNVEFGSLNALVGISGAGKTTIIVGLQRLVQIAQGAKSHSFQWNLSFIDDLDRKIEWSGELSPPSSVTDEGAEYGHYLAEILEIDGVKVISRSEDNIQYNGVTLPKLDSLTSLIYQFRDEDGIADVYESLNSMTIVDVDSNDFSRPKAVPLINAKIHEEIINSGLDNIEEISKKYKGIKCREKIYYAFKFDKNRFDDFIFAYSSIFPSVKTIEPRLIEAITDDSEEKRNLIYIDMHMESGEVVNQHSISSGMFKTMMILAELYFGNNKSPIVIDEIENSLGVNCLSDVLSEMEVTENQIILTSHHPKVINMIPAKFWSIVSRKGNVIFTKKAESIIGSTSSHDKFIQLINSKLYRGE